MSHSSGFLAGAPDRLLPASIPFRFFLSAALFHVLAWAMLLFAAHEVARFRGGTGATLAAIHLATLGVLAMSAIGASFQLLPVVTRRPLARDWPTRLCFWLMFPGIILMTYGMAQAAQGSMQFGAILVSGGLAVFLVLTADNLRRASSVPVVSAHGWLALVCLVILATQGLLLIWDFQSGFLVRHTTWGVIHMLLAFFGFMGLLVLGFSLVLIPMLSLSRSLPHAPGWAQMILTIVALAGVSFGALLENSALLWASFASGLGAAACYLWLMQRALATRMRKRLGLSFVSIRVSWAFLVMALILWGSQIGGAELPNATALTGFVVLVGWLLTFLFGVLQRIMPFLASMHAAGKSGLPPLLTDLTSEGPLKLHMICHFLSIAVCSIGIIFDQTLLIQLGAASGLIGAISFSVFTINVVLKLRQSELPA